MTANTHIETGIEYDSDVTPADADIFAFVDDGEYATVFEIDRLSDTLVRVQYYRCEAGLSDHVAEETFSVDADKATEEWARECANADPEAAIEAARDHFDPEAE
jgi:hypothetical protein